jgi:hypothetical protein
MVQPPDLTLANNTSVSPTVVELPPISALTRDLLSWLASTPRTYMETMDAWRSSCPRLTIWEDALADGLVQVESGHGSRMSEAPVVLTPRGHAALA